MRPYTVHGSRRQAEAPYIIQSLFDALLIGCSGLCDVQVPTEESPLLLEGLLHGRFVEEV